MLPFALHQVSFPEILGDLGDFRELGEMLIGGILSQLAEKNILPGS